MNSSRWMFTSMISKCHSISITIHRSTRINLFSDRQAHKRIRTTLVHTGTLSNLTSWSDQQHLITANIAPSMRGNKRLHWLFWRSNECIFDQKDYFKLKRIDRKPNYVGENSITSELKPLWVLNFTLTRDHEVLRRKIRGSSISFIWRCDILLLLLRAEA